MSGQLAEVFGVWSPRKSEAGAVAESQNQVLSQALEPLRWPIINVSGAEIHYRLLSCPAPMCQIASEYRSPLVCGPWYPPTWVCQVSAGFDQLFANSGGERQGLRGSPMPSSCGVVHPSSLWVLLALMPQGMTMCIQLRGCLLVLRFTLGQLIIFAKHGRSAAVVGPDYITAPCWIHRNCAEFVET